MKRVVYVCTDPGVPVFGCKGASAHVQAVLGVLVTHGVEAHLVCPRIGGETPDALRGLTVHELPAVVGATTAERETSAIVSDAAVPDVLDALAADGPIDLIYERYAIWGRSATAWAARAGVPSLLEVNAPLIEEQALHRGLIDSEGAESVARSAIGQASGVICVSEFVADWARRRASDHADIHTVANGVDTRRVAPAANGVTPADADPFTIGFVGTLKPWHGVGTLVDALPTLLRWHPGYRLLIVGDGPEAEALGRRAAELGVSHRVEATGAVDPGSIPTRLRQMDVAVAPYPKMTDFYFSPLKIYEYLASGLPVVASRVGSLPEVLEQGRLGSLVSPDDPDRLASAIDALRRDESRRAELKRSAVAAAQTHDWTSVVERTLDVVHLQLPEGER